MSWHTVGAGGCGLSMLVRWAGRGAGRVRIPPRAPPSEAMISRKPSAARIQMRLRSRRRSVVWNPPGMGHGFSTCRSCRQAPVGDADLGGPRCSLSRRAAATRDCMSRRRPSSRRASVPSRGRDDVGRRMPMIGYRVIRFASRAHYAEEESQWPPRNSPSCCR